jgi:hypothetical protein
MKPYSKILDCEYIKMEKPSWIRSGGSSVQYFQKISEGKYKMIVHLFDGKIARLPFDNNFVVDDLLPPGAGNRISGISKESFINIIKDNPEIAMALI